MARRLLPNDAMDTYLRKVSSPSIQAAAPSAGTSISSRLRQCLHLLPRPSRRIFIMAGVVVFTILLVVSIAIAAHAQKVCALKPFHKVKADPPAVLSAWPLSTSMPSPSVRSPRSTPSAVSPTRSVEHHDSLLYMALLVGLFVGRRTMRQRVSAGQVSTTEGRGERPARRLGAASVTGLVRETNQDRVIVTRIADQDVILVSDGLGGCPRGAEAAEIVTTYALKQLETELPEAVAAREDGVRALLLRTIWGAAMELASQAARESWQSEEMGLRSTLIVVVASRDVYLVAWVGDGGVFLVRSDDSITALLEPHKKPEEPDVLLASLGPVTEGTPSWCIVRRFEGDLVVVATDGISDRLDRVMVSAIKGELDRTGGDAEKAARALVEKYSAERDEAGGFVFHDNLTLALLTTGTDGAA